jgi:hypothetical protein
MATLRPDRSSDRIRSTPPTSSNNEVAYREPRHHLTVNPVITSPKRWGDHADPLMTQIRASRP